MKMNRYRVVTSAVVGALLVAGCGSADELDDSDGGTDTDADTDIDSDSDADADCGEGACGPPWGWYDETSGLCWQDPPCAEPLAWEDAIDYCDSLMLCGRDDWRLPSISELRTFVRGCSATMPGGECGVTDECGSSCGDFISDCMGACPGCEGPGMLCGGDEPAGHYFDPEYVGGEILHEMARFWSSTPQSDSELYVWILGTSTASISDLEKVSEGQLDTSSAVMCVRDGP
jgi:hypothetical protein